MYRCESWTIKKVKWRRTDAFELWCWRRFLRVPWTNKIQPVHPIGNQPWIFTGRTDAEAEAPIHWPPDTKNQLIGKDPDAGKDGRREEKGSTQEEMVGWHHRLNGRESEQTPGDREGKGAWRAAVQGVSESDTTEQQHHPQSPPTLLQIAGSPSFSRLHSCCTRDLLGFVWDLLLRCMDCSCGAQA